MSKIAYLYINGLGDGTTKPHEKLAQWWWQRAGVELAHMQVNWYEGSFEEKLATGVANVEQLLERYDGAVIMGASAGGSLAVNIFGQLAARNVCAVSAHARLRTGDFPPGHRMAIQRDIPYRHFPHPSPSFYDSMTAVEQMTARLTPEQTRRILTLTQLTDLIVPTETMTIPGAPSYRSFAFGHSGGFLAHFLADRDRVMRFAQSVLSSG